MRKRRMILAAMILALFGSGTVFARPVEKSDVSEKMLEGMTQDERSRRLSELARSVTNLERRIDRLDDRLERLDNDVKEIKRKV